MTERTRTELSRTLEPADDLAGGQQLHTGLNLAIFRVVEGVARFAIVEDVFNVLLAKLRSPENMRRRLRTWFTRNLVPRNLSCSQGTTAVAGGGRHRNLAHSESLLQIRDQQRVLKQTATQTNILDAFLFSQVLEQIANQLGACLLQARRQDLLLVFADFGGSSGQSKLLKKLG